TNPVPSNANPARFMNIRLFIKISSCLSYELFHVVAIVAKPQTGKRAVFCFFLPNTAKTDISCFCGERKTRKYDLTRFPIKDTQTLGARG
ncbi:MAG: hypothetical protein K2O76_05270, partial [Mailhella sp.]|nr:hypothetical protein [Mailhella sp.]